MPFCARRGHEVVAEHQVDGNGVEQIVIDGAFAQVDEVAAIARGYGLRLGGFTGGVDGESGFISRHKRKTGLGARD